MKKIRMHFREKPWSVVNSFIRSLYSGLELTGQVDFAHDIEDGYDVLFLDEFKTGVRSDSLCVNSGICDTWIFQNPRTIG